MSLRWTALCRQPSLAVARPALAPTATLAVLQAQVQALRLRLRLPAGAALARGFAHGPPPKKRQSLSRSKKRRGGQRARSPTLRPVQAVECAFCGSLKLQSQQCLCAGQLAARRS